MIINKILIVLGEPYSTFSEILFKYFDSKEFSVNNKYLTDEQQFEKRIFNNIEVIENKLQEHSIPFLNLTFKINTLTAYGSL